MTAIWRMYKCIHTCVECTKTQCIYIYIYIYIYICIYIYIYTQIYIHTHIYLYIYIFLYIYTNICIYINICIFEFIKVYLYMLSYVNNSSVSLVFLRMPISRPRSDRLFNSRIRFRSLRLFALSTSHGIECWLGSLSRKHQGEVNGTYTYRLY